MPPPRRAWTLTLASLLALALASWLLLARPRPVPPTHVLPQWRAQDLAGFGAPSPPRR